MASVPESVVPVVENHQNQRETSGDSSISQGLPYLYVACSGTCTLSLEEQGAAISAPARWTPEHKLGGLKEA